MNMFFGKSNIHYTSSQDASRKQRRAVGSPVSRVLISLSITLLFGLIYFYFALPALNFRSPELFSFLFMLIVVYCVSMIVLGGFRGASIGEYATYVKKSLKIPAIAAIALAAIALVGGIAGWVVFRASSYSKLISIKEGNFAQEVSEISFSQIPMLDDKSANNLANRKLGELSDLVSQFTLGSESAQINYKGKPVRVLYLNYGNFFKWVANNSDGIPAYMYVDMVTQEVSVVRTSEGIKYSPSEYFGRDLMRKLRFSYPTLIFDNVDFEIDEDGTPYWIASVVEKKVGLFGGTDIKGAVLLNAITGETSYKNISDVPAWVDRVYSAALIIDQYDYYGRYHNGFFNSLLGQKDCTETTDGYNYIAQDDDVWLYTGITSVSEDRGNIGFILVNQRTKDAHYYSCAGAEEFSAASSAEGAVQQFGYVSTFPLLLNVSDQPTYFMALKDAAGLVKSFAMVNVQQYQIVATGSTVMECSENYRDMMIKNSIISSDSPSQPEQKTTRISGNAVDIRSAAVDGNTVIFIKLDATDSYFTVSAKDYPEAVILNVGDSVTLEFEESLSGEAIIPATMVRK